MSLGPLGSLIASHGAAVVSSSTWRRCVVIALILASVVFSASLAGRAGGQPPAVTAHEWLVDDQGRQYRLERIAKTEPHVRLGGDRVRFLYGIAREVAGEDADSFLIKVYRDTGQEAAGPPMSTAATSDDKAKIAATYAFDLRPSQTLQFEPFDQGLPRSGQWRFGFVLADMNGDGHLDLVHGPPRRGAGPPVIFLGDGAGHWRRWPTSFPPQRYDYGHVAVADFNGDGHLDIAMGMHLLGITVLLGDGAGRFTNGSQGMDALDPLTAFSSHALVAVDWDGDGRVDLVGLAEGPRLGSRRAGSPDLTSSMGLVFYRNQGGGTWQKNVGSRTLAGDALVLAKSRPEGRPWLVAGSITQGQSDLVVRPGDPFTLEKLAGLRRGATVRAVALADFDGDGHEDVAVAYDVYEGDQWRSGIDLLLRGPNVPEPRRTVFVQDGAQGVTALGAGDLDGDGRPDLVALSGHGEILVLRNAGGGAFTREDARLTERTVGCRGYQVRVEDLDRDGLADIVAGFAGEPEGLGTYRTSGCPGEGSLRAWRSRRRS